jgi:hypothetical protein
VEIGKQKMWQKNCGYVFSHFGSLGSLTGTSTSYGGDKGFPLHQLAMKSLWQLPPTWPQLPHEAMWASSWPWAPSSTARCANSWHILADSWPWAHKDKSFSQRPLFLLLWPFVKVQAFLFCSSRSWPLSLLALGPSSMSV